MYRTLIVWLEHISYGWILVPQNRASHESILFVIDRIESAQAGTEGQLYTLMNGLHRDGYDVRLLVLRHTPFVDILRNSIPVDVLDAQRISSPKTWWRLLVYGLHARRMGCGLAHVFFNDASVICPPIFRLVGIKTLISRRDMGYWYTPMYLAALRMTRWSLAGVVTNSEAVREVTAKKERISAKKIQVIYNGYKAEPRTERRRIDEIERFVSGEQSMVLVLVANIRPIKRIEDAVRALGRVIRAGASMKLLLLGGGDPSYLRELAREIGVGNRVIFLGARTDVIECLAYADCGLMCSQSEGYSNAIVEYMYAGLPVVATDVGGNREAVMHGRTGYLYPVGDVDSLTGCLLELAHTPTLSAAMGQAGKELARRRHDSERMLEFHKIMYRQVLGRRTPDGVSIR